MDMLLQQRVLISIHAAREGGDTDYNSPTQRAMISIHAAREGGDRTKHILHLLISISIHAAREGGDRHRRFMLRSKRHFNPRRP